MQPAEGADPQKLTLANEIARLLINQEQFREAQLLLQESWTSMAGLSDWPTYRRDAANLLPVTLVYQSQHQKAEAVFSEILEAQKATLGIQDPTTQNTARNLASVLQSQRKLEESANLLEWVWEQKRSGLGDQHSDTLQATKDVAQARHAIGKLADCASALALAASMHSSIHGPEDPRTMQAEADHASVVLAGGNYEEAERLHRCNLEKHHSLLGKDHETTKHTVGDSQALAKKLCNKGQQDAAAPLLLALLDGLWKSAHSSRRQRG